jgi:hypothetical protein
MNANVYQQTVGDHPVFPTAATKGNIALTKLEYFTAAALTGLLAAALKSSSKDISEDAVTYALATIEALNAKGKEQANKK